MADVRTALLGVAELAVPGTSNLIKGDVRQGLLHVVAAAAARSVAGPVGHVLVMANSLSKSSTGTHLYDRLNLDRDALRTMAGVFTGADAPDAEGDPAAPQTAASDVPEKPSGTVKKGGRES